MKTRSHPSTSSANSALANAQKTTNVQDTNELLTVTQQISEANELRKSLNNRVLALKKTQITGSKKVNSGSKAIVEQIKLAQKMHSDTQVILKSLETHKMCLTNNAMTVAPFDFVESKAALDDIHARHLKTQNADNEPEPVLAPGRSKAKSKGRSKTQISEALVQDGSDVLSARGVQQKSGGSGSGEEKRANLSIKAKTSTAARREQIQRPTPNIGTKRVRGDEDEGLTARKKVKQVTTKADDDLESDLSSIEESTGEDSTTAGPPIYLHDGMPNTVEVRVQGEGEDIQMLMPEHPVQEPAAIHTVATPVINSITETGSDTMGEDVGAIGKAIAEVVALPNLERTDGDASEGTSPRDQDANKVVETSDEGVGVFDKATAETVVLPSPDHMDGDTPARTSSKTAKGCVAVETTEATVVTTLLPKHAREPNTTEESPNDDPGQPSLHIQHCAHVEPVKEISEGADENMNSVGGETMGRDKTREVVQETNGETSGQVTDRLSSEMKDEFEENSDSSLDSNSDSDLNSDSEYSDSDSDDTSDGTSDSGNSLDSKLVDENDGNDGVDMRLANAHDIEDLQRIANDKKIEKIEEIEKTKGTKDTKKKSKDKQEIKTVQRDTLRLKWDSMGATQQKEREDKAMKQIEAFLRSPSTHPIPIGTRALIREVAEFCVPACHLTRQLSLHILQTRYQNLFCIFHQKTDKGGQTHDLGGRGMFRVTGTPFPRLVNEKPKKMFPTQPLVERREGYLHCGCLEDEALLELYWWKMAKATSPATGVTEGWLGHRKMDPRTRTLMFGFFTEWTHMKVDDIFTGDPTKSAFNIQMEQYDTKIARLQNAKGKAVEKQSKNVARKQAKKVKREERRAKKEAKRARRKVKEAEQMVAV